AGPWNSVLGQPGLGLLRGFLRDSRGGIGRGGGIGRHGGLVSGGLVSGGLVAGGLVIAAHIPDRQPQPRGHDILSDLQIDGGVVDLDHGAEQARGGGDTVTDLQAVLHLGDLVGLFLLAAHTEEHRHEQRYQYERKQEIHGRSQFLIWWGEGQVRTQSASSSAGRHTRTPEKWYPPAATRSVGWNRDPGE